MKDLVFDYAGDDGSRMVSWFKERLLAIECCMSAGHAEAALTLIYSAIDTPISALSREGGAREVWYRFRGRTGVNLLAVLKNLPLRLDIEELAIAITQGGCAFIRDLIKDPESLKAADARAQHFFRWGMVDAA